MKKVRRAESGMTLLEILVVIAILGLIIAVLAYYVFPSDDRRCRLEAERLAAYMTGAAAEAVMRDGASRVSFSFNDQSAKREITRQGAAITQSLWDTDKKAKTFTIEVPVKLDTVDTEAVPKLTSGTGYVVFRGHKTEGGVVIVSLNQAAYSVVIPPGDNDVRVEKGRSGIPGAKNLERPKLPDLTGYADKKLGGSAFPASGVPRSMPITRRPTVLPPRKRSRKNVRRAANRKKKKRAAPRANPSNTTGGPPSFSTTSSPPSKSKATSPSVSSSPSSSSSSNNVAPEKAPVANPPAPATNPGVLNANLGVSSDRNYLIKAVQFDEPSELKGILTTLYNNLASVQELLVIVRLEENFSWLVQGRESGTQTVGGVEEIRYKPSLELPSYRMTNVVLEDEEESDGQNEIQTCNADNTECTRVLKPEQQDSMVLFLRNNSVDDASLKCKYYPLQLVNVVIETTEDVSQVGLGVDRGRIDVKITAMLRPSDARRLELEDNETLLDVLEDKAVAKNADTTGDGDFDGWKFEFRSTKAIGVAFEGDPSQSEQIPSSCGSLL